MSKIIGVTSCHLLSLLTITPRILPLVLHLSLQTMGIIHFLISTFNRFLAPRRRRWLLIWISLHAHLREQLRITIQSYERAAEGARQEIPPFAVGDLVWLDARNIRTTRPAKKLDHKRLGPFPVTEIVSSHARRLGLRTDLRSIHNVFHVSLLEPATHPPYPGQVAPPPPPIIVDDVEEFEVSRILDSRTDRRVAGHVRYLVAWAGYEGTAEEQTWVTYDALEHAPDALRCKAWGRPGLRP